MKNKRPPAARNHRRSIFRILGESLLYLLVFLSFLAFFSARWYRDTYGALGFDSILYTLFANLNGVESDLLFSWMGTVLPPTVFLTAVIAAVFAIRSNKRIILRFLGRFKLRLFPVHRLTATLLCLGLCTGLLLRAANISELDSYIANLASLSRVFEEEYRDPGTTSVTFPAEKRNLIYIFMESMETSFLSTEQGGALSDNVIPELYALAQQNINFSHNSDVGGFAGVSGDSWTIGAMVSQTAGVPLKLPPGVDGNDYGSDSSFLPGLTSITDLLHSNGYYQTLMVGSDASFGGRKQYYEQHGVDQICDLFTAREDGIIPEDYKVWWGFEDKYLFQYAKQKLTELAALEQPFAFTMLTADTHHIGGYMCDLCENVYEEQYENVYACASRQIAAFVSWLQEQDFYEDTAIIIAGDHPSMDNGYFLRVTDGAYSRHVYNCFINSSVQTENTKNRWFCAYDMLPTTLAAMGCSIAGDRLGLGTNLFSELPTLLEETSGEIIGEIGKNSKYYTNHFFFS